MKKGGALGIAESKRELIEANSPNGGSPKVLAAVLRRRLDG